jgi:hypothetical protein
MEENQIKDDISSNDKSSTSRIKNSDLSSISGNKYYINNQYLNQNNSDISSNLSDLYNPNYENQKEVRYMTVNNPLLELYKSKEAIIKVEYNDCCCCSEFNNIYSVFTKVNNNNGVIKYLFEGKEFISCKDYSCSEYCNNPFTLGINKVIKAFPEVKTKPFAKLEKCFSWSCFCFCRPQTVITICSSNKILGKIKIPFSMGDTTYQIYNPKGKLKFVIDADYCQLGIICMKNICCCLPEVFFEIYESKENNQICGNIQRIPGKYPNFMHVLDCYQILFPTNATGEERFLIICAVFMIEYQIFRSKSGTLECCSCDCGGTSENENCCQDCLRHSCLGCCSGLFRF